MTLLQARFQKSVSRKRLHKVDTVSLGEKVKLKLEERFRAAGRRVNHLQHLETATPAVQVLNSFVEMNGSVSYDAQSSFAKLEAWNELERVVLSKDPCIVCAAFCIA